MARQVSHPNVCRVYDVGEYDGHTFLSMEYVDGEDLASLLRRIGRFPQDRAIELARQICAGLAAAHDRGVVHRDLKPANIMLDGSGKIRITDFGLAGATGEALRAGTPAYMAPEQLAGGEVTPRSDIYALGLVLYELFTGQRALDAANMAELIAKREQADITPPTAIVRDLDPGIERVIMRCLEPDPARRPASALAVAAALPGGDPLAAALGRRRDAVSGHGRGGGHGRNASRRERRVLAGLVHRRWNADRPDALSAHPDVERRHRCPSHLSRSPIAPQEIVVKLGYGDMVHVDRVRHEHLARLGALRRPPRHTEPDRWNRLRVTRPETYIFWYRTSPRLLRRSAIRCRSTG